MVLTEVFHRFKPCQFDKHGPPLSDFLSDSIGFICLSVGLSCADVFGTAPRCAERTTHSQRNVNFNRMEHGGRVHVKSQHVGFCIWPILAPHFAWFRHISMGYSWYTAYIYIYTFRLSVSSESRRRPEAFAIAEAVSADVDHLRLKVPHDWLWRAALVRKTKWPRRGSWPTSLPAYGDYPVDLWPPARFPYLKLISLKLARFPLDPSGRIVWGTKLICQRFIREPFMANGRLPTNLDGFINLNSLPHRIHGAGIYANIGGILMGSMAHHI